jgi:hypothetical protein
VFGAAPVTAITEAAQYTGTVSWSPAVSSTFAASTELPGRSSRRLWKLTPAIRPIPLEPQARY